MNHLRYMISATDLSYLFLIFFKKKSRFSRLFSWSKNKKHLHMETVLLHVIFFFYVLLLSVSRYMDI